MAEFFWAVSLFAPGNTFERPTYKILASIAPETVWAFLFLIMFVFQVRILYKAEYHTKFAVAFAAINSTFWTFVCLSMVFSVSPFPAAISGEISLAVGAIFVFIRSGKKTGRRTCDD